jgi:hypothetical protein
VIGSYASSILQQTNFRPDLFPETRLPAYWVSRKLIPSVSVLGNSATSRGTLQRKEGDIVLLLPPLPSEGVKLL